jgi:hypothetical protein
LSKPFCQLRSTVIAEEDCGVASDMTFIRNRPPGATSYAENPVMRVGKTEGLECLARMPARFELERPSTSRRVRGSRSRDARGSTAVFLRRRSRLALDVRVLAFRSPQFFARRLPAVPLRRTRTPPSCVGRELRQRFIRHSSSRRGSAFDSRWNTPRDPSVAWDAPPRRRAADRPVRNRSAS